MKSNLSTHPKIRVVPIPIEEKCTFKCGNSTYEKYILDDIEWHKKITKELQQLKQCNYGVCKNVVIGVIDEILGEN